MIYRAGQILQRTLGWLVTSPQVVQTSLQTGSPSANSESPLILHFHNACVCRDETGDWNRGTSEKICGSSKIISVHKDACKFSNFLFLWFRIRGWNGGDWPFELLEKYETAASLRLPVALLLWTQTETVINLSWKKKPLFTLNHVNKWDHEIEALRFPSPHLAVSSQPRDVTSLSGVTGQVIEVEINGAFPGGLKRTRKERYVSNK